MRFGHILFALAAAAFGIGGGTASAQLAPTVSGFSSAPTTASEEEYWFFIRELGRCLTESKYAQSVALIQTTIDSAAEKRAFDALMPRKGNHICMRNMVRATFQRAQLRGAIAESLYELQPVSAPQAPVPQVPTAPAAVRSIHDFADCYIAGNYAEARQLLADTKLGTQAEHDRVREMAQAFGACLPAGRATRIVPVNIRLALAGALYRAGANSMTEAAE